jgi:hypothetical protein
MSSQSEKNPAERPANDDEEKRLVVGAEQQVGAGEDLEEAEDEQKNAAVGDQDHALRHDAQPEPGTVAAGADPDREIPSAAEAEDRGGEEQRLKDDEEAAELDDALDDSFPASDPPAQTSKGKVK